MKFVHRSVMAASVADVFAFHERADALPRLLPPWESFRNLQPAPSLAVGSIARLEQRVWGPVWVEIVSEHVEYEKDALFVDEMRKGPFRRFRHEHRFVADAAGCCLEDSIEYEPPLGLAGRWGAPALIEPRLRRMFEYRHRVTAAAVCGEDRGRA